VTLFLVAINDITEKCIPPVKFNLYADDFNFWCKNNNKITVQSQLQITAINLEKWTNKTGFHLSPEKPSCTTFTKKIKVEELQIILDNTKLTNKNSVKIFGIIFDKRLS